LWVRIKNEKGEVKEKKRAKAKGLKEGLCRKWDFAGQDFTHSGRQRGKEGANFQNLDELLPLPSDPPFSQM
jgi:hypothetical protein